MKLSDLSFNTKFLHHNNSKHSSRHFLNPSIHHGSTVAFPTLHEFDHSREDYKNKNAFVYGRLGTPTTFQLEELIADMEHGYGGLAVSSGLEAINDMLTFVSF